MRAGSEPVVLLANVARGEERDKRRGRGGALHLRAPVLLFAVPHYARTFRAQNASPSAPARWTLAAGRWAELYWYILPLFGLFILPWVVLLSWLTANL